MLFGILDLAREPSGELETGLAKYAPDAMSLYREPMKEKVRRRSPFLASLPPDSPFMPFWREHGRGRAWGIVVQSDRPFDAVWRHFRRFLTVALPDGQRVLFRFYDPRVFPTFLRSCNQSELAMWFAGIKAFRVECVSSRDDREFTFDGAILVES
jgi:hypothetical protein